MSETLWITLPLNEENALKAVINSIASKNLINLSINQLIEKLENNQAADWLEVLSQYSSIPSINNMDVSNEKVLGRARSVRNKFDRKNTENQIFYPDLKNETFAPNKLLGLVILCYSNPNLIGPKLCKALNAGDAANIKKEILENSARVGDRVAPWASNLRLANYALYANDTSVRLPVNTINRVKNETIQKGLTVHIVDQRGGFDEWVNGTERAARSERAIGSEDPYAVWQSLRSSEEDGFSDEKSQEAVLSSVSAEVYFDSVDDSPPLIHQEAPFLNVTNNAASVSSLNGILVSGLALFHVANQIPVVGPVMRNICKDAKNAISFMGNVFSKDETEHSDQIGEKTPLLSSIAKP